MGLYLAYEKHRWTGISVYGLALGLALLSNHPQMLYYMLFTLLVFGVVALIDSIKQKTLPSFLITTGGLLVISLIALASSASKILPTLEYADDTMRGKPLLTTSAGANSKSSEVDGLDWTYATNWSNGWMDVVAGFIPGAAGGGSVEKAPSGSQTVKNLRNKGARVADDMRLPLYWGSMDSTGGAFYFGAVLLFFILLHFFTGNKNLSWWLGISLLLLVIISMGRNMEWFNRMLFDYFPYFNKFRTPNSVSSIISAIMGLGAAFGLHALIQEKTKGQELKKAIIYAGSPLLLISLFFALLGPSFFDFSAATDAQYAQQGFDTNDLIADRQRMMRNDAFRSFIFVALAAAGCWLYAIGKIKEGILIGLATALAVFDQTGIGRRYLSLDDFKTKRQVNQSLNKRPVDDQILKIEQDRGAYRVYDLSVNTFNSAQPSYWHNTIGGYHPAKLQRFEDVKNYHLFKGNQAVLNMMNTKYVITRDEKLQQNPGALGNGWFVNEIKFASTNDEEISALNNFNPRQTAVLHQDFAEQVSGLQPNGQGTINMTAYEPVKLTYTSNSNAEQLAVFSEVWYGPDKGWTATIDGEPTDILRANYLLRALRIPAGNHEIIFEFNPSSQRTGNLITLIASLLLIGLAGYLIFRQIQKSKAENKSIKVRTEEQSKSKMTKPKAKSKKSKKKK